MIHFDTSVLVDLLRETGRGRPGSATAWVEEHRGSAFAVSRFVLCELEAGVAAAAHPERERERIRRLVAAITLVHPTETFASRYGTTSASMRRAGVGIDTMDLLIAVTALEDAAPLVTSNQRHFVGVPGLEVLSYR
jgi:tRNA(fMet)-specific endonuclease VapC